MSWVMSNTWGTIVSSSGGDWLDSCDQVKAGKKGRAEEWPTSQEQEKDKRKLPVGGAALGPLWSVALAEVLGGWHPAGSSRVRDSLCSQSQAHQHHTGL